MPILAFLHFILFLLDSSSQILSLVCTDDDGFLHPFCRISLLWNFYCYRLFKKKYFEIFRKGSMSKYHWNQNNHINIVRKKMSFFHSVCFWCTEDKCGHRDGLKRRALEGSRNLAESKVSPVTPAMILQYLH